VGMSVGESKQVPARFPDDYGAKSVAGKSADFDVRVTQIEAQSLSALDEEFAKQFGVGEGGVPALRAEVRKTMEREIAEASRSRVREQLFDALYRDNPIEVPQTLVDEQIQELQQQMARRMGAEGAGSQPREAYEAPARRRVALGLIVGEIVRAQQLKVDRARVDERLAAIVAQYPDPEAVRRQYLGSRAAMEQIESAALEDQAVDWALSQAKIADKTLEFAELTGFSRTA
jgi:trigger factor